MSKQPVEARDDHQTILPIYAPIPEPSFRHAQDRSRDPRAQPAHHSGKAVRTPASRSQPNARDHGVLESFGSVGDPFENATTEPS
jgi:hypothetical protein